MTVSNIMKKWRNGISSSLQDLVGITQGIIYNILGMLHLTPWKQIFFLISGSVFVSNIMEGE